MRHTEWEEKYFFIVSHTYVYILEQLGRKISSKNDVLLYLSNLHKINIFDGINKADAISNGTGNIVMHLEVW